MGASPCLPRQRRFEAPPDERAYAGQGVSHPRVAHGPGLMGVYLVILGAWVWLVWALATGALSSSANPLVALWLLSLTAALPLWKQQTLCFNVDADSYLFRAIVSAQLTAFSGERLRRARGVIAHRPVGRLPRMAGGAVGGPGSPAPQHLVSDNPAAVRQTAGLRRQWQ
ncbi:hypothetical protein I4F81_006668 [Pyropia yezoensis]|uniref:Uncharacterized protein n=1 Tax=Pyropia yezoensis TaxID=2788 RepID=A0ACC3C2N1_PYRYE|nr:hypothetical protein I4F81_006668 [Neopyropia yezoensis]